MTDQDDAIKSLTRRIQRLEDLEEIRNVFNRYSHAMDSGFDSNAIATLFTEDAVWSIAPATPVTGVHRGRDAIREFFAQLPNEYRWTMHNMGTEIIDVADDGLTATGTWYLVDPCTMKRSPDDEEGEAVFITGIYRNRFTRADGFWQIQELAAEMWNISTWETGWVREQYRSVS